MRWLDDVEKDLRNLRGVNWKTKVQAEGWLEKVFRAGQDPQRAAVSIIKEGIEVANILVNFENGQESPSSSPPAFSFLSHNLTSLTAPSTRYYFDGRHYLMQNVSRWNYISTEAKIAKGQQ
jgi:hypothetical protein